MGPFGPEFADSDEVRAAVEALDIGALYRSANRLGVTQRQIAVLTGQTQSEVCEILKGRQVVNVHVLRRVADGFGISRERMFLGYGEKGPQAPSTGGEVDEKMKRRVVLAAMVNEPYLSVRGEPITLHLPTPTNDPLPSRVGMSHVHAVRTVTEQLRALTRYCGGQADQFAAAVRRYTRWRAVPAPEVVKAQLAAALAELHTEAGWSCHDSGLDGLGYFTRGMELAHQTGDTYAIADAAWQAGLTLGRSYPNDALKLFTLGKLCLGGFRFGKPTSATPPPDDPRLPTLTARLTRGSASAYARMGGTDEATRYLAEAHDGWEPRDAFERAGADFVTGGIQLDLGRLDAAEQSATRAVRTYGESHRRDRTQAQLLLAEVHVRAGEHQGLILARHAIAEVSTLQSVVARRARLIPLATALEARPSTDTRELARVARQVAATRI